MTHSITVERDPDSTDKDAYRVTELARPLLYILKRGTEKECRDYKRDLEADQRRRES